MKQTAGAALAVGTLQWPEVLPAAAVAIQPFGVWLRRRVSPNEQIRVACIGLGQRGSQHWQGWESVPGAVVVALCDVDQTVLARQAQQFRAYTGRDVRLEVDYRRLLDDGTIDAVSVATCNHTHALITLTALQAGKHVYVEKLCSHNLWEGAQLVRAVQKYRGICFHGTQARSSPAVQQAISYLQGGLIGQVEVARIRAVAPGPAPTPGPDEPTPPGVAYDLWLGPAPVRPFNRARFHRHWRWWPEYGNGPLANHSFHLLDLARWGLGVSWPQRIRPGQNLPNGKIASSVVGPELWQVEFPGRKTILVELWPAPPRPAKASACWRPTEAVTFYGTEGQMVVDCFGYRTWFARGREPGPAAKAPSQEFEQFLQAVRTRHIPPAAPDILEGHRSCGLVHLINIARHLGRAIEFDPETQTIPADPEAFALCRSSYRKPFLLPEIG